jgi:pyruvate/2-oxoacid:ferredoxin oxidoreductase alpha subunit
MIVQSKSITLQAASLPTAQETQKELEELRARVRREKTAGREIVVVGLGFVGIVMAAVITDAADGQGKPAKFVIGLQRPSPKKSLPSIEENHQSRLRIPKCHELSAAAPSRKKHSLPPTWKKFSALRT